VLYRLISYFIYFILCTVFISCSHKPEFVQLEVIMPVTEIKKTHIISRNIWTREGVNAFDIDKMTKIYRITIHHTAIIEDSGNIARVKLMLKKILAIHKHKKHWADIGYHYLIDREGRIWEGRNINFQGAHARGDNNIGNIGIALLGNFDIEKPTLLQVKSLKDFTLKLQKKHGVRRSQIFGHEHFTITQCPGKFLIPIVDGLKRRYVSN